MNEIWKDISGWPFYQISNLGRIRVLPGGRTNNNRLVVETEIKKSSLNTMGYATIVRRINDRRFLYYVHVLVLNEFFGLCPPGWECRHLNGNPSDNRLENLEWSTHKKNMEDMIRHGTTTAGERQHMSKLRESDIINIRSVPQYRGVVSALAREYNVTHNVISLIRSGKIWKHVKTPIEYDIPKYPPMHLIPDMKSIEYPR